MSNCVDFHIHSIVSDGSDTIPALYQKVKHSKIHTFSVTDHDRIEGTLEMDQYLTNDDSVTHIRGIEFSCITSVKKCHILGYDFHLDTPEFLDTLNLGIRLRSEKTARRIDYWKNELGIELTKEEADWLYSIKSPGRPHFGQIIVNRGLAPDLKTAIQQYVAPCKVGNDRIDASTAVSAILHAGGVSVWAHPLGGEGENRLSREEFYLQLDCLIKSGIQGLECYYSRYSGEDINFLIQEARKHNLLISGGSDYHGDNKPNLHIGKLSEDDMDVDINELSLYEYLKKRTK